MGAHPEVKKNVTKALKNLWHDRSMLVKKIAESSGTARHDLAKSLVYVSKAIALLKEDFETLEEEENASDNVHPPGGPAQ